MGKVIVVFVGPAGSGKSTLVAAYSKWLREGGIPVYTVNLDPAVDRTPYEPDFDVRTIVDAREIARKYGLGPNGALVKSMEFIAENLEAILSKIASTDTDYVLVDTPGQMEVFLFRDLAWRLGEGLKKISEQSYAIFILDASVIKDPADYAFLLVMSTAVQLRLNLETAPVINKADLAPNIEFRGDIWRDYARLSRMLKESHTLYTDMLRDIMKVLLTYNKRVEVPRVSALKGEGMEELHRLILEMGCSCGDLS